MRGTLRKYSPVLVFYVKNQLEYALYRLRVLSWARGRRDIRVKQPIFMLGCPRSGTTICGKLFGGHPDLSDFSEAGFVWDPRQYFNPQANHLWTEEDFTSFDFNRLHQCFEYFREQRHKARFFNKHPRNSVRIGYIRKVFPDAIFLHVIRDGRATVLSIVKAIENERVRQKFPFGNFCKPPNWKAFQSVDPIEQAALQWNEIVRYVLSWRDQLQGAYYEIRYEDFCLNPRGVLGKAYAYCGLPDQEQHLSHIPESLNSRNFKWQEQLTDVQKELILSIQKDLLHKLGYLEAS
jgi:hypothetical protein